MRILLSAYSISPDGGSEEAVGWNWALAAARRGHDIVVLTPPDDGTLAAAPTPPNLTFAHVPEPRGADLVPGQLHWYVRYLRWQRAARRAAPSVMRRHGTQVIHHLTWASLQLGSGLGGLGVPLVFGPVGGGQTADRRLRRYYHGSWAAERLRTLVTTRLIRLDPFAVSTMRQAAVAVADNEETAELMTRLGARRVHRQTQCGVQAEAVHAPDPARRSLPELTLLWVGRVMPRKGLPLAIEAMRRVPADVPVKLRIVGYGPLEDQVPGWISAAGVGDRVEFVGRVSYEEMPRTYRDADALLFTSIRDSGGIQLVEAMGQGLPCIVLRQHGARLLVDERAGIQVPVGDADTTAKALAQAITDLASDRDRWWTLAQGAHARAGELTWDALVEQLEPVLESVANP